MQQPCQKLKALHTLVCLVAARSKISKAWCTGHVKTAVWIKNLFRDVLAHQVINTFHYTLYMTNTHTSTVTATFSPIRVNCGMPRGPVWP